MTRRSAMRVVAAASAAHFRTEAQQPDIRIAQGPFIASRASLMDYRIPAWYADAKFGIWAHWGPQSAPEVGDWYARNIYIQGHKQYEYHGKTYGHPSKFGYKDIIPTWKAENFDPDYLLGLYKKAGARFFVSVDVHHDNFDLWNSKFQPRWNAVAMGPKKNIVKLFRDAARKQGLRFGVSTICTQATNGCRLVSEATRRVRWPGFPTTGTTRGIATFTTRSTLWQRFRAMYRRCRNRGSGSISCGCRTWRTNWSRTTCTTMV